MIYIKSYEQYFCLLTFLFYFKNVLVLLFISGIIYIETIILLEVYMNNKGFTLVELLVTLVLLGIIATISITGVVSVMNNSKNSEYKVLLKNIDTGAKMFYEDCEYGSLRGKKLSNGDFVCNKNGNKYEIPISTLIQYGFLTGDSNGRVLNPKDNKDIKGCKITISYGFNVSTNKKEYTFTYNGNEYNSSNLNSTNYFESCGV